jgi:hypothetical protein
MVFWERMVSRAWLSVERLEERVLLALPPDSDPLKQGRPDPWEIDTC